MDHTPDSVLRFLRVGLATLSLLCTLGSAAAQCPDEDGAAFRVSAEFYRFAISRGETVGTAGPADRLSTQFSFPGSSSSHGVISTLSCDGGGEQLSIDFTNDWHMQARRLDGNLDGGGFDVRIEVYVKGSPGASYYLIRSLQGRSVAEHPAGAGETEASGPGGIAVSHGGPPQTVPLDQYSFAASAGTLSTTPHPSRPGFFLATTLTYTVWGYTWQTPDICFPGCPQLYDYRGFSEVHGYIQAGLGPPPCTGTVSVDIGGCDLDAGLVSTTYSRQVQTQLELEGNCGCCEYRQFVHDLSYAAPFFGPLGEAIAPRPSRNCVPSTSGGPSSHQPTNGPCQVEDSSDSGGACRRYGYRGDPHNFVRSCGANQQDLYGSGPSDRPTSCIYRACDQPTYTALNGRRFQMKKNFESRLVVRAGEGCATSERVLAVRHWSACCEGTGGSPANECSGRGIEQAPPTIGQRVIVGGRVLDLWFWRFGTRLAVTVGIPLGDNETLSRGSVTVSIPGLSATEADGELLDVMAGPDWRVAFADLAFETPACFPREINATVEFAGSSITIEQPLQAIAPPVASDFDGNGHVEPADVSLFVSVWFTSLNQGTLTGDFDHNGNVEPADVSLFVATWFNTVTSGC